VVGLAFGLGRWLAFGLAFGLGRWLAFGFVVGLTGGLAFELAAGFPGAWLRYSIAMTLMTPASACHRDSAPSCSGHTRPASYGSPAAPTSSATSNCATGSSDNQTNQ